MKEILSIIYLMLFAFGAFSNVEEKVIEFQFRQAIKEAKYAEADSIYHSLNWNIDSIEITNEVAQILEPAAELYQIKAEFVKSVSIRNKVIEFFTKSNQQEKWFNVMVSHGDYYRTISDLEVANKIFNKLEEYLTVNSSGISKRLLSRYYHRRASLEIEGNKNKKKAIEFSEQSLLLSEAANDLEYQSISLNELGHIYETMPQFEKALLYYQKAYELELKLSRPHYLASIICHLSIAHSGLNQVELAEQYLAKTYKLCDQYGFPRIKFLALLTNAKVAFQKQEYALAMVLQDSGFSLEQDILYRQYQNDVSTLNKKLELNQKEIEIRDLKLKTKQAGTDLKNSNDRFYYAIGSIMLVVISFVVLSLFYGQQRRRKKLVQKQSDELAIKNEQLKLSITEKEELFQELNHRVNNNLQFIIALLQIESDELPRDDPNREFLKALRRRIYSIAYLQQELYGTDAFEKATTNQLLEAIFNQTQRVYRNSKLNLKLRIDSVPLTIEQSQFLGLLFSEILIQIADKTNTSSAFEITTELQEKNDVISFATSTLPALDFAVISEDKLISLFIDQLRAEKNVASQHQLSIAFDTIAAAKKTKKISIHKYK